MKRAIIYGLGRRYQLFKEEISKDYEIIAISDKDHSKGEAVDILSIDPKEYDIIVVPGKKYYEEIKNELQKMGIKKEIVGYENEKYEDELKRIDESAINHQSKRGTSFSDLSAFPSFCLLASKDEEVFSWFKRSVIFSETVEHSLYEDGQRALKSIINSEPRFSTQQMESFLKNDLYGSPRLHEYTYNNNTYWANANTLIYIWQLQKIASIFADDYSNDNIKSISEIGVGFGGLCRLICDYWGKIDNYSLVDLPEVLALSNKYLNKYGVSVNSVDGTQDFDEIESDLVISNWAFSELTRNAQEKYIEKIISKSKHGFMIWNPLSEKELDGMRLEEFIELVPSGRVISDDLLGASADIVIW